MKPILSVFFLLFGLIAFSQDSFKYYDYQWKPCDAGSARFISKVEKTDSGWLRNDYYAGSATLQFRGLFADSLLKKRNVDYAFFYPDGRCKELGHYTNNKRSGLRMNWHYNGMMSDSITYLNGNMMSSMGWHSNGYMSDSCFMANDMLTVIEWFDNAAPAAAGRKLDGKKQGKWQFFHKNGQLAAQEVYDQDKLLSRIYYDTSGNILADTTDRSRQAEFPGGAKGWQNFILKRLYFPDQYKIVNSDIVTVVVSAIVDEDGKVSEPFVEIPFNPAFDKIALDIFRKTPKWIPAMSHNRLVKQGIRQPVSFRQE
jgi:antitoxin component YwqK of YwqJK toxin-antitoxin module